jgi:hypothetical protein
MLTYNEDQHAVNLADLALRIRAAHDGVQAAARISIEHALTAGDLLIQAKKQLKHGQWLPWLEQHCKISDRTAQRYIQLARHRSLLEANPSSVADLTLQGALELISAPRTSAGPSEGNPRRMRRMWSEANAETRRQFADAVGREVFDYCSPDAREAILDRSRRQVMRWTFLFP